MVTLWKHPTTQTYYFRRGVPAALRAIVGVREVKESLKTRDLREAKVRFVAAQARCEERFESARATIRGEVQITPSDAREMAARWFHQELARIDAGEIPPETYLADASDGGTTLGDHFEVVGTDGIEAVTIPEELLQGIIQAALASSGIDPLCVSPALRPSLMDEFTRHLLLLSRMAFKRRAGDWSEPPRTSPGAALSHESSGAKGAKGHRVSAVFKAFAADKLLNDGDTRTARKTINEYRLIVERFIEHCGDLPVEEVTRQVVTEYRAALSQMPSKGEGIRKMTTHEQIAHAQIMGLPTLSPNTIKNRLRVLSSVIGFGIHLGFIKENPVIASGVTKRIAKAISKSAATKLRREYTMEEMVQVFQSHLYRPEGWSSPRADLGRALFWVPLLAAYTGARREELCQLFVGDVKESPEGIPYISILETYDPDDERTVKNTGSRRAVPIHPDLIALGFLQYVEGLPTTGQLFPRLQKDAKGFYSKNYGKHWAKYLTNIVQLHTPATPTHGFRHAFKTLCREAGIPEDVHDALTGHSDGSVSRTYGSMPMQRLAEEMARFPSIVRHAGLL